MATIFHLPNPRLTRIAHEEALTLVIQRRTNRRVVKPKTIKRAITTRAKNKKAPNKMELLAALTPEQAKELLLLMGEGLEEKE